MPTATADKMRSTARSAQPQALASNDDGPDPHPVIVLELNELSHVLVDEFIAAGKLPGFKALRDGSVVCVTDAGEDPPALEPWIQWVTVHTGLSYQEHQVFNLDDGARLKRPRLWDIVSSQGQKVWVCGSMNAAVQSDALEGQLIPDPWATGVEPHPPTAFDGYYEFVRRYVQEYSRGSSPVTLADSFRFVGFMMANGLSLGTLMAITRQLLGERDGRSRWRRATILDRLQWDLFRKRYRSIQPLLATFFLNSTAHFQHYYWRNMQPDLFRIQPPDADQLKYKDAILYGYEAMDAIVAECLKQYGSAATIVLCTALGQQAQMKYEQTNGKTLFRVKDIGQLVEAAGLTSAYDYAPVMADEFWLTFPTAEAAAQAEAQLLSLRLDSGQLLLHTRLYENKVHCGCSIIVAPRPDQTIVGGARTNRPPRFHDMFYPLETMVSGCHHRDGMLWIHRPKGRAAVVRRRVSLQEIAPTLLRLCGVATDHPFDYPPMPEVFGQGAA